MIDHEAINSIDLARWIDFVVVFIALIIADVDLHVLHPLLFDIVPYVLSIVVDVLDEQHGVHKHFLIKSKLNLHDVRIMNLVLELRVCRHIARFKGGSVTI